MSSRPEGRGLHAASLMTPGSDQFGGQPNGLWLVHYRLDRRRKFHPLPFAYYDGGGRLVSADRLGSGRRTT